MGYLVSKFGGTSVATASQIGKVAAIVRSDERRRFIVVSAPGKRSKEDEKITDILIACHAMAAGGEDFSRRFEPIRKRFHELADELGIGRDLDPWIDEVENDIAGGADSSAVVSRGEYLGAHMIARYLGFEFVDATELIRFSDPATVDRDETDRLIGGRLDPAGRYVIPGFYGARSDGSVQLFTRGGSDISAALVARGVGAELYENWTDVSGLLSADPRLVDSPKPIDRISYRGLRELAWLGAAVFHDEAVAPVADAGIPINIRNTNAPDHPGTMIGDDAGYPTGIDYFGVAGRRGFRRLIVRKPMLSGEKGVSEMMWRWFEDRGISVRSIMTGGDTAGIIIADPGEKTVGELSNRFATDFVLDDIKTSNPQALVGACMPNIGSRSSVVEKLFSALEAAGISLSFSAVGYSDQSVLVAVPDGRYEDAVRSIYTVLEKNRPFLNRFRRNPRKDSPLEYSGS